jgi:hypothetical protein
MVNKVGIITTIAAIMIPVTYFPAFPAQGASTKAPLVFIPPRPHPAKIQSVVHPPGSNMTSGSNITGNTTSASNMTGAAGNTTAGTHDTSIHTTNPAGKAASCPPGCGTGIPHRCYC